VPAFACDSETISAERAQAVRRIKAEAQARADAEVRQRRQIVDQIRRPDA
jgi:hypothetical protein